MRGAVAVVLVGLGVFGVVLTLLLPTVVVDRSKRLPLDLDITLRSSGPATILDPATSQPKHVTVRATQVVRTDTKASDGTNTTIFETLCIVIVEGTTPDCVDKSDPRLLSVTTDRVVANRKTSESVNVAKYNEQINGQSTFNGSPVRHVGMSYTWPIDSRKQTYQFFQPDLNKAYPATYQSTDKIDGLTVYKYVCDTGTQPYRVQGLFDGTYTDTREVWVEPRTGVIVKGRERQIQRIAGANDPSGPGTLALDTTLTFDQSAIDFEANYAKDKINQLKLAQLWAPLVTGIIGVGALVGAFFLLRPRRAGGSDGDGQGRHD